MRIAVLASGRGSNLAALLAAQDTGGYRVAGVFSDKPASGALTIAHQAGLPSVAVAPRDFTERASHDRALFAEVARIQPDLIVCAGYMRIISSEVLAQLPTPMINIHPSLLPRHPGLDTHARALAAGDTEHGSSVHLVTAQLDGGPLIAQARLSIHPEETPECLAARVLEEEHRLLPACVAAIASKRITFVSGRPRFDGHPISRPLLWCANRLVETHP